MTQFDPSGQTSPEPMAIDPNAYLYAGDGQHVFKVRPIMFLVGSNPENLTALVARGLPINAKVHTSESCDEASLVGKVLPCKLHPRVFSRVQLNEGVYPDPPPQDADKRKLDPQVSANLWRVGEGHDDVPPFGYLSATDVRVSMSFADQGDMASETVRGLHLARLTSERGAEETDPKDLIGCCVQDDRHVHLGAVVAVNEAERMAVICSLDIFDNADCGLWPVPDATLKELAASAENLPEIFKTIRNDDPDGGPDDAA